MPAAAYIAVDWGTSSFRLWTVAADSAVINEVRHDQGMTSLRRQDYPTVLNDALGSIGVKPGLPTVICGMAGAKQGWRDAGYLDIPTRLDDIASWAESIPGSAGLIRLVPGLAQRDPGNPDVMRGEETQLLGAIGRGCTSGTFCMPGTHSKWVQIADSTIEHFSTSMTGEVYAILRSHSVLSHATAGANTDTAEHPEFTRAVEEALAGPEKILSKLFSVRSRALLLSETGPDDMRARLSGLLLGVEVSGVRDQIHGIVTLVSNGPLAASYRQALQIAGIACEMLDGEAATRRGLHDLACRLWPERIGADR